MNNALMFGRATDEWATPRELFKALDREFFFGLDAAATPENSLLPRYLVDALNADWHERAWGHPIWVNPPYSQCREFIAKAAQEAQKGCTVVCLIPSRTDTRYWHEHIWDVERNACRPGVEIRFIKGRLKFGNSENSAPFPSVVIVFRPCESARAVPAVAPKFDLHPSDERATS